MPPKPLIHRLRQHFALDWHGIHGSPHWARDPKLIEWAYRRSLR